MARKRRIILGFYGTTLDRARGARRWDRWRPTIALFQDPRFIVDRFELLYSGGHLAGATAVAEDIRELSPDTEIRLHEFELSDPWDFEGVFASMHEFSRGYSFDTAKNDYLVHITTGSHVMQICWFLLTESRHFPAQLVQTSPGATKNRIREPGTVRTIDLDLARYDRIARRLREEHADGISFLKSGIETRNSGFNRLIEQLERVAIRGDEPILLTGPTGAGKSQLAAQLFQLKKERRGLEGQFVEVNCATVRGDGAMSTLFGHVKGAFTGAQQSRPGLLRSADRGLLFLDEIGELGLDEQAMLLRAIEHGRFYPVGTDQEASSNFRLLAGTNRDLRRQVQEGRFREDLLARINLWTFRLPALRERPEDIEPNLEYQLDHVSTRLGNNITINKEARTRFLAFAVSPGALWSANFRDFNAALLRMATLAPGGRIDVATVREEETRLLEMWSGSVEPMGAGVAVLDSVLGAKREAIDRFDQVQLTEVIRVCRVAKSLSDAGRQLFDISRLERKTQNDADRLRKYLARFGLDWRRVSAG